MVSNNIKPKFNKLLTNYEYISKKSVIHFLESNLFTHEDALNLKLPLEETITLLNHINSVGNIPILKVASFKDYSAEKFKEIIEEPLSKIGELTHNLHLEFRSKVKNNFYKISEKKQKIFSTKKEKNISTNNDNSKKQSSPKKNINQDYIKIHRTLGYDFTMARGELKDNTKLLINKKYKKLKKYKPSKTSNLPVIIKPLELKDIHFSEVIDVCYPDYFNPITYYRYAYGNLTFRWPSTNVTKNQDSILEYLDCIDSGLLGYMGYRVGINGLNQQSRRIILRNALEKEVLPEIFDSQYTSEWGQAKSILRLKKMAYSLAQFTKNAKLRTSADMTKAIKDWEDDLKWLKENFYDGVFDGEFQWPSRD